MRYTQCYDPVVDLGCSVALAGINRGGAPLADKPNSLASSENVIEWANGLMSELTTASDSDGAHRRILEKCDYLVDVQLWPRRDALDRCDG